MAKTEVCEYRSKWTNEDTPTIQSGCGESIGARWVECGWKYCPFCGKRIKEAQIPKRLIEVMEILAALGKERSGQWELNRGIRLKE